MSIQPAHKDVASLGRAALALPLSLMIALAGCDSKQPIAVPNVDNGAAIAPPIQPAQQQPSPAPPPLTPQQQQAQRATQQLIASVERSFSSGESHYRKGQLVQAKADFDNAVDMMLASGMDIKNDPQLSDEFNRILDSVNALEMEALKRGNGFWPAVEPTPSEVANDVTFEVDPNIVAKAKAELATTKSDLPLVINDYVAAYINFFANTQKGHNTLKHSLQRSGRYKAMIQRALQDEGVPQDLIYLAVAESAFQPHALNPSGAGGMWQFMPHGDYGLARNGYIDERFDPEKSTQAYAKYMKFLYNQLGDWYLAMAAYDWGAGSIQRAVMKTGYADFWELYKRNNLPAETKDYVPKILAAIIISRNLKQYGFDDIELDPPIVSDTVSIDYSVDLRLAADIVDTQLQDLLALNPGLLRPTTPPPGIMSGAFDLHLPPGTATLFQQRIAEIPVAGRTHWRYHRVVSDETLASIARSYHVTLEQLASANQLHSDDSLDSVDAVVVPVPLASSPASHTEIYKARRGDSLVTIADRFGVSLEDLRRWNHVTGTSIAAGQRVRVTEPARLAPRTSDRSSHASSSGAAAHKSKQADPPKAIASSKKSKTAVPTRGKQSSSTSKTGSAKSSSAHHKSKANKNIQK